MSMHLWQNPLLVSDEREPATTEPPWIEYLDVDELRRAAATARAHLRPKHFGGAPGGSTTASDRPGRCSFDVMQDVVTVGVCVTTTSMVASA